MVRSALLRARAALRLLSRAAACAAACASGALAQPDAPATIEQVRPAIVAVGTFERTRNPQFTFAGTGFGVGDGSLVATNAHVLPKSLDTQRNESLAIAQRSTDGAALQVRAARVLRTDAESDLALLKVEGAPLPALRIAAAATAREGETYLFTGYPIGGVLGLFPVTHRTMIAAVTPIVIPAARSSQLDARAVRQLAKAPFWVYQLDGTAYPGNSGSPVYRADTGEVIAIVNSVLVKGTKESALAQPSGITYAIPAQKLKELLAR